ncbi:MAG: hypothetical protein ACD_51C00338G0002 [uncultured bacterium]|nr:MAG: hypothetical protein ACD_51C00338G0002 [uncultured bacterium]
MATKVAIAMSGGVDSSVAAALLLEQGYECMGLYMDLWEGSNEKPAREIAKKLGIEFYKIRLRSKFKKEVINYYLESYVKGETPNPCVVCNPRIKFGELFKKARELGCEKLATGHYARIMGKELRKGADEKKDQSYFLYRLSQKQLSKILFPLGDKNKTETRRIAGKLGLEIVQNKEESQGICFISDKFYTDFLKKHLPAEYFKPGLIKDIEGNKLGRHKGLPYYTNGQRKGIGVGGPGGPYYVIKLDHGSNELIVGKDEDLWHKRVYARDLSFISGETPKKPQKIHARIRHLGKLELGTLEVKGGRAIVTFAKPVRAFTGGQSIVFYDGEQVLGGGIMELEK